MKQINRRETNTVCYCLAEARDAADQIVEFDLAAGMKVSTVSIDRHAKMNIRGEFNERYFVKVESHDGD